MVDVLVVDDDPDIRSLLQLSLALDGHAVSTASGGEEALAALAALPAGSRPVVILDIQMPDVDGWEVLERVRRARDLDPVPVLLCTVRAAAADYARGWRAGCDAYIPKPFDLPALAAHVVELSELSVEELIALRHTRVPAGSEGG